MKNKTKRHKDTEWSEAANECHVWSNSSLLGIGPSSAAEERVRVVSKHGCYMFS